METVSLVYPLLCLDANSLLLSKHGKFRPNLLALAVSNTSDQITSTTSRAFQLLSKAPTSESPPSQTNSNVMAAIAELVTLKGIGPASASLLLSVFAPADVPFFSDEAFRWIKFHDPASTASKAGGRGWDRGLKYNKKEYVEYLAKVQVLVERLRTEGCEGGQEDEKVGAREVEMVGWVLGREHATLTTGSEKHPKQGQDGTLEDAKQEIKATATAKKRKPPTGPEVPGSSDLRRSKRTRN
ncbi:hypothetical protein FIBSPDRAFT_865187 [Athelia psychrophila]|uniref:Uncharacterized protein n=1 Tax=Athelia psychrophila TaxID=1759441 RepID=A0A166FUQ5_9AGAM|nr:hypothetical protein FIBSPDRAFT_865187 [Fibularhizoctonia sp. CBS 109695]